MIYPVYSIGGEIYHSNTATGKAFKYIDKVRTKSGKWRYIYQKSLRNKHKASELTGVYAQNSKLFGEGARMARGRYNLDHGKQYLTDKDKQELEAREKKFSRVATKMNNKNLSDDEINKKIEDKKELIEGYRKLENDAKNSDTKEYARKSRDREEQALYDLEKKRQDRQGNVKLGRQR